jgi:hypothetical protein
MRDASTLILQGLDLSCLRKSMGIEDLRAYIVDYHCDTKTVFASEDMLKKGCLTSTLYTVRKGSGPDTRDIIPGIQKGVSRAVPLEEHWAS